MAADVALDGTSATLNEQPANTKHLYLVCEWYTSVDLSSYVCVRMHCGNRRAYLTASNARLRKQRIVCGVCCVWRLAGAPTAPAASIA